MSNPISQIELSNFRGATNSVTIDLDSSKDMTLVFGENGSGKSTILDAIDVVCNGTTGSLQDISVGRSAIQYLCSLGAAANSLNITVHSGTDTWIAAVQRSTVTVTGNANKPRVNILRRNKILDLVTAQPRERYRALESFIDTSGVESSEENLRLKLREINTELEKLADRLISQKDQLHEVWEGEGTPGGFSDAFEWAKSKVSSGSAELSAKLNNFNSVANCLDDATESKRLHIEVLAELDQANMHLHEVKTEVEESPGIDPLTSIKLIDSLSKAKDYIDSDSELTKCPTCLRDIPRDELLAIVNTQLSEQSHLKSLSDKMAQANASVERVKARVDDRIATFIEKSQLLAQVSEGKGIEHIDNLTLSWPEWSQPEIDVSLLQENLQKIESTKDDIIEVRDNVQKDVNQHNTIKQLYDGITRTENEAKDLERIRDRLQKCHEIVHNMRISFVDNILSSIAAEANRLYQQIHPGEQINISALKMDPAQRGSVLQTGEFHGHEEILPQAVYSESHMDTLGFCVWLALAKQKTPSDTVLLIDDTFTSVDNQHLQRIIDLLSSEAPNFLQVILTTHYRLWWDRCQHSLSIQRLQLGQWDVSNGIVLQNMSRVLDQLREAVAEPIIDRQLISSKSGILLENILWSLSLVYKRPVPATEDNQHTLGELYNACSRLFNRHSLTVQHDENWNDESSPESWQDSDVLSPFTTIGQFQLIRNQVGCHFNEPGAHIPDREVKEFGMATIALVEGICCPCCGFLASKPTTDGTALRCKCPKQAVRMTPVRIS